MFIKTDIVIAVLEVAVTKLRPDLSRFCLASFEGVHVMATSPKWSAL